MFSSDRGKPPGWYLGRGAYQREYCLIEFIVIHEAHSSSVTQSDMRIPF